MDSSRIPVGGLHDAILNHFARPIQHLPGCATALLGEHLPPWRATLLELGLCAGWWARETGHATACIRGNQAENHNSPGPLCVWCIVVLCEHSVEHRSNYPRTNQLCSCTAPAQSPETRLEAKVGGALPEALSGRVWESTTTGPSCDHLTHQSRLSPTRP